MNAVDLTISQAVSDSAGRNSLSLTTLAKSIGLNRSMLYRRINSGGWLASEIAAIAASFGVTCQSLHDGQVAPVTAAPRRDHWVYRHYNDAGELLYVGCTMHLKQRRTQHALAAHWYPASTRCVLTGPLNRTAAYELEARLIRDLGPRFNVQHSGSDDDKAVAA